MWLMLNNSFLSIVDKDCPKDCLLVRARRKQDITINFPAADVVESDYNDYRYRAVIKRKEIAIHLANVVEGIDYGNFKNSVKDYDLKSAYSSVWSAMYRIQKAVKWATGKLL